MTPPDLPIPVCAPLLAGNELKYVTEAISSGWISSAGNFVTQFENQFAQYLGRRYAVSVTSGTAAMHLACLAANIGPGDEVIVPTFTMIASAYAIVYCGAIPVFVDCLPGTLTLDPALLVDAISPATKAIMAVPIYGQPCDISAIRKFADRHSLALLEDAAEGLGSAANNKLCGSESAIAGFSFFANKLITTGEGGMVVTDSQSQHESLLKLRNMGFPLSGPRNYQHECIGFNYRMTNLTAALGLAQLEQLPTLLELRRANAHHYNELLATHQHIITPIEEPDTTNSYWMYGVQINGFSSKQRDQLIKNLKRSGIESRAFFVPMHQQPILLKTPHRLIGSYPVAEQISSRGLYLPSGPTLTKLERQYIANQLITLTTNASN